MRKLIGFIGLLTLFFGGNSYAQNYNVHALYIYSFTKYVHWPESYTDGDFVIGILGQSDIVAPLRKMASLKKAGDRLIQIVEFATVDDIQKCNILFVPESISDEFDNVRSKLDGSSTLLLTEKDGLGKQGSAINFILRDNRLLFEMNKTAIESADLKISQELVKYAILI